MTSALMSSMSQQQMTTATEPDQVTFQDQYQNSNIRTTNTHSPAPPTAISEPSSWDLFEKEMADFPETCDGDEIGGIDLSAEEEQKHVEDSEVVFKATYYNHCKIADPRTTSTIICGITVITFRNHNLVRIAMSA